MEPRELNSNPQDQAAGIDDRRLWPRGPSDVDEVAVRTSSGREQTAKVVDESTTGLSLRVADASELSLESEVQLLYNDEPMWAIVRYIGPLDDGHHTIGLEWGTNEIRLDDLSSWLV